MGLLKVPIDFLSYTACTCNNTRLSSVSFLSGLRIELGRRAHVKQVRVPSDLDEALSEI
jgi:hypothetical protein